jgi:Tfp pilus assembly protein PilO
VNDILARWRNLPNALGTSGATGVGLIVLGVSFWLSVLLPAQRDVEDLRDRSARIARDPVSPADAARDIAAQREQGLQRFFELLPTLAEQPEWLLKLHDLAAKNGLTLESGEYKFTRERDWRVASYRITLPLKGSYQQIRRFLAQLQRELPAAVVEEFAIKREAVSARDLEARVRLAIFLTVRS